MYKIALIPGDGIGPEVTNEAMKVFGAAADKTGFKYETMSNMTSAAIATSKPGRSYQTVRLMSFGRRTRFFWAPLVIPDVTPGILEKGILLRTRFELDLYINLRPVKLYPGVWTPIKDKGTGRD